MSSRHIESCANIRVLLFTLRTFPVPTTVKNARETTSAFRDDLRSASLSHIPQIKVKTGGTDELECSARETLLPAVLRGIFGQNAEQG